MADPVQPEAPVSREAYYRWLEAQPSGRFERVDRYILAMAPERIAHLRVKAAVWQALREAINTAGIDCEALPDGATVASGDSDFEPDAVVNCGAVDDDATVVPNPVIVVEVLAPSTQTVDTGVKLAGYFAVTSVHHYLIVHPQKHMVIHHRHSGDASGAIETRLLSGGVLRLDPPGVDLDLDAFYTGSTSR